MDLGLDDKIAWVVGASSGLGLASAWSLAREGTTVAISARRLEDLKRHAGDIERETGSRCLPLELDVTDPSAIEEVGRAVCRELGGIDICVANAGGPTPGTFGDLGEDQLRAAFDLTTASAWRLAKVATNSMQARQGGAMIFITSGSVKEPIANLMLSNMMRPAVVGLAKTLSKELGPQGIRVVCVAPGRIQTDRVAALDRLAAENSGRTAEDVAEASRGSIPLGRYGDPAEFGDVVAFVASERASYMTGNTVVVDGGALRGLLT
ncbi:MAG: SDR family oxidoreductase [Actinomycetota bacterium]|nr:SDR family oxidoreductase [Actinomycetota bacterium]